MIYVNDQEVSNCESLVTEPINQIYFFGSSNSVKNFLQEDGKVPNIFTLK